MLKFVTKNALLLGIAAAACVTLVAGVNQITAPKIAEQQQIQKLALLQEVLSNSEPSLLEQCIYLQQPEVFGADYAALYRANLTSDPTYIVEVTAPDGYSGDIQLLAAIKPDATVLAVRVLAHKETPGLGDKIELRKSRWILSFDQQQVVTIDDRRWAVKKDGGEFDQFAGATITPRAIVNAVKTAALYLKAHPELLQAPAACTLPKA